MIENISNYDAICKEVHKNGGTLKDNRLLLADPAHCRKWYHLYDRSEEDQQYMLKIANEFIQQSSPKAMQLAPRAQRIRELATLERLSNYSTIEWLIPVTKDNLLVGILTVISCVMI